MSRVSSQRNACQSVARLFLFFLVWLCFSAFVLAQDAPRQIRIRGKVTDPVGASIVDAVITLDPDSKTPSSPIKTDKDGVFELRAEAGEKHILRVTYLNFKTRNIELPAKGSQMDSLQIVLEIDARPSGGVDFDRPEINTEDVQFSDAPNFTVSGVTDWSNVGLHCSDTNVKTSEALTKDTAALKSSTASGSA